MDRHAGGNGQEGVMGMLRWYIMQTYTGREEKLVKMIHRVVPRQFYGDCFVIYHEQLWRRQQENQVHIRRVFPGYVFITSENPDGLFLCLKHVPAMSKLLADGKLAEGEFTFLPLDQREAVVLGSLLDEDHIIRLSYVATDGKDHVLYISGPLETYASGKWKTRFSDCLGASDSADLEMRSSKSRKVFDSVHKKISDPESSIEMMDECHSGSIGESFSARTASSIVNHAVSYRFRKRYAAIKISLSGEEKEIHLGIILNDDIRRELSYGKVEAPVETSERYHVAGTVSGNDSGMLGMLSGKTVDLVNGDGCRQNLLNVQSKQLSHLTPGDAVIVSEGPLVGLPAIVCKVEMEKHQVKIKVNLFGQALEMKVPSDSLRKI